MRMVKNINSTVIPRIICNDGFIMSVQASEWHYCIPRENYCEGYFAAEIGYPNREEPLLLEYMHDSSDPTTAIYSFVPVDTIKDVIKKHGGSVNCPISFID